MQHAPHTYLIATRWEIQNSLEQCSWTLHQNHQHTLSPPSQNTQKSQSHQNTHWSHNSHAAKKNYYPLKEPNRKTLWPPYRHVKGVCTIFILKKTAPSVQNGSFWSYICKKGARRHKRLPKSQLCRRKERNCMEKSAGKKISEKKLRELKRSEIIWVPIYPIQEIMKGKEWLFYTNGISRKRWKKENAILM